VSAHDGDPEGLVICNWDLPNSRKLSDFIIPPPLDAAFSPDGRILAARGTETIEFWETGTGLLIGEVKCPNKSPFFTNGCLAFSPDGHRLASALNGECSILVWDVLGALKGSRDNRKSMESRSLPRLWDDLKSANASQAYQAIWELVSRRQETAVFLKERLKPVLPTNQDRIARLIHDLDDKDSSVREKATSDLQALKELAQPALQHALEAGVSLEVQKRIKRIMEGIGPLCSDRLLSIRVVAVLEYMQTKESIELLEMLAKGATDAWLTKQAKGSLDRLKN